MRVALIIVVLTSMAMGLVYLRRGEVTVRHEIQQLESQHQQLRRVNAAQQVTLARLVSLEAVRRKADELSLRPPHDTVPSIANRRSPERPVVARRPDFGRREP